MKIPGAIKAHDHQRTTRWDLIKKRHANNATTFKSDAVRRLIEMDFVDEKQRQRLVQNESETAAALNPAVVMELRHEMCKRSSRNLPLATVQQKRKDEWCKQHNLFVEERHINNELNKLRQQLERQTARYRVDMQSASAVCSDFDNKLLYESLKKTSRRVENFYKAPLQTLDDMESIYKKAKKNLTLFDINALVDSEDVVENDEENISEEILECIAEIERSESNDAGLNVCNGVRCVRFNQNITLEKYQLQHQNSFSSNSSDGLDSVISDLAEEALQELREEEELKLENKKLENPAEEDQNVTLKNAEQLEEWKLEKNKSENPAEEDQDVTLKNAEQFEEANEESPNKTLKPEVTENQIEQIQEPLIVRRLELPAKKAATKTTLCPSISTESDDDKSSVSNQEQSKIIEQLFQARAHTNIYLLRQYFLKWIHYTTLEKISRESSNCKATRVQQINTFLDKLRREKTRINKQPIPQETEINGNEQSAKSTKPPPAHLTKKYQNKIKIQQDIIDMQRLKLERQERIIMELKLHKISDESRDAREELKQELKMVIQSGDPKAKAKAKCLQLIGNLRDKQDVEEEELARLQGKALFLPKFLQNMQERCLERSVRHEQARQRRLQAEAEREALKIAAEEARRQEDENVKQLRIDALREKRRLEKWAKIQREQQRQRAIENHRKSLNFCRFLILRRVGMEGFKRLLERKRRNQRASEQFKSTLYKRNYLRAWKNYCDRVQAAKLLTAKLLYEKIFKRRIWLAWQAYIRHERSNYLVAVDWYELRISEAIFKAWFYHMKRNQLNESLKMRQATSHHNWHTKWKVLDCWRRLPQILQIERQTEERRQRWRMKIWELLPDYQPNLEE